MHVFHVPKVVECLHFECNCHVDDVTTLPDARMHSVCGIWNMRGGNAKDGMNFSGGEGKA